MTDSAPQRHLRLVGPGETKAPVHVSSRGEYPQPPDGSVVRFVKSGYGYACIRRGPHWETSATQSVGFIDEIMAWDELWSAGRCFEQADEWAPVKAAPERDARLSEESVVRFTVGDVQHAAIAYQGAYTGFTHRLWFTTRTPAELSLANEPGSGYWNDTMRSAREIQVATSWRPLRGPQPEKRWWWRCL